MSTTTAYEITVGGHLDDRWSAWLGDVAIRRNDDHTTTLTATLADQAQLHGLLTGLRDVNAPLVALRSAPPGCRPALTRPLRTGRLTLRPAAPADTEPTWAVRRLPSVHEWLTGCPDTLDAYRELFTRPDRLATTVVAELAGGVVIGDIVLRREDGVTHLGWALDPAHTGHGCAAGAVRRLLRHCFEELGVRRVVATCYLADDRSWRLMERVGMRREVHAVRECRHRSGAWLDTVGYAVLEEEWRRPDGRRPGAQSPDGS